MPLLADRTSYEASIVAQLAPIFHAQYERATAARSPSAVPYTQFQSDLQTAMADELFQVFTAAGAALILPMAFVVSQGAFEDSGRQWANAMGRELAAQVVETSQRMTREAFQLSRSDRNELATALALIYLSPARLNAIAVTETTRAVSAGEHAVVIPFNDQIRREGHDNDGRLLIPIWRIDPASNVCEFCLPLDGHSREVWAQRFPYGPPGHPVCACWLSWVTAAEFARGDTTRGRRRAA